MTDLSIYRRMDLDAREIESLQRENERLREQVAELTGQRAKLLPFNQIVCAKCAGNCCGTTSVYVPARKPRWWRKGNVEHFKFRCGGCGAKYRMHVHGARP